jgi:hypothetical protein
MTTPEPRPLVSEAEFIAAEQEIAFLRPKPSRTRDDDRRIDELIAAITESPPPTGLACVVKLRLLAHPDLSLDVTSEDFESLRQVTAFLEQRRTASNSRLGALGYVEAAIRSIQNARGRLGKTRREADADGTLSIAVNTLEGVLDLEIEVAAKDLSRDLALALGPKFTVAEFDGARAVLSLVLGALPPPLTMGALGDVA